MEKKSKSNKINSWKSPEYLRSILSTFLYNFVSRNIETVFQDKECVERILRTLLLRYAALVERIQQSLTLSSETRHYF